MAKRFKRVLVTGGAGYVGSNLVPKLLNAGYEVAVLDLFIYGDVFAGVDDGAKLIQVKGDLRNAADAKRLYKEVLDKNPTTSLREEISNRLAVLELK